MNENTYTPKETPKAKILKRFTSSFRGLSRRLKFNSYMEYLVELPNGQNVYMSKKEVEQQKILNHGK